MRRLRSPALLSVVLPIALMGQARPLRLDTERLRLGADTIDLTVVQGPQRETSGPLTTVHMISRGTGPESDLLIDISTQDIRDADGTLLLHLVDTTAVGWRDLRLRRVTQVRFDGRGTQVSDFTVRRTADGLERIEHGSGPEKRTTLRLAPTDSAPYGLPVILLRAAPLAPAWRATLPLYSPTTNDVLAIQVDSVAMATVASRRAWQVHAHADTNTRFVFVIDSTSRDLIRFAVTRVDRALVVTSANRRFPIDGSGALPAITAADSAAMPAIAGHYYLRGVMEMGSELLLRPNGTFEYMLAYGALDEASTGRWVVSGDVVLLQGTGTRRFDNERLTIGEGTLTRTLDGRRVVYVRR
jgi:hypothetical protein